MTNAELAAVARHAAENAYAPYSGFRVGAAIVAEGGEIFTGANVENAAYGAAICAESTAIAAAVSLGARRLTTVAVACIDAANIDGSYPCGQCRQRMNEFGVETVIVTNGEDAWRQHTLAELLPYGFKL